MRRKHDHRHPFARFGRTASTPANDMLALVAAAGIGALTMYLMDPARGRRRRKLIGDKVVHLAHTTSDVVGARSRDVMNHVRGLRATARRSFSHDDADDAVIHDRVRAELGRVVSHPSAIEVSVEDGDVTLSGPVLASEAEDLLGCVRSVRGVGEVHDQLELRETNGSMTSVQGHGQRIFDDPPAAF